MHHITPVDHLSDRDLLDATERVGTDERHLTAELLALLGELDVRRLYLGQSCASLFTYCTQVLHLSEHATYHRIEAARAARQFPIILDMVAEGALTLTTVTLLRSHLTRQNHEALLGAACHKSKREVAHQVACLAPKPDERTVVRKLASPVLTAVLSAPPLAPAAQEPLIASSTESSMPSVTPSSELALRLRATLAPLSSHSYLLRVTLSGETYAKLRRAQDLIRHTIPNGDPAIVIDRALTLLVDELERAKVAKTARPRQTPQPSRRPLPQQASRPGRSSSRHIPAAIRRTVWARDEGRCAFVGARGRCGETGRLEFHHVIPFADGGPASVENLALRCHAHNSHEAQLWSPT